jgi:hypothetical protein
MSHFVRLEVVVDAERPELCGHDCPAYSVEYVTAGLGHCAHFGGVCLDPDSDDEDKDRRDRRCLAATTIDEAEQAVIEAAIRGAGGARTLEQADALYAELEAAIDALAALRDEGKESR